VFQQDNQYPPSIAEPLEEAAKCSKTNSARAHSERYGKEQDGIYTKATCNRRCVSFGYRHYL